MTESVHGRRKLSTQEADAIRSDPRWVRVEELGSRVLGFLINADSYELATAPRLQVESVASPQCRIQPWHRDGVMVPQYLSMAAFNLAARRGAALRSKRLTQAQAISIGFNSGLYGGRY